MIICRVTPEEFGQLQKLALVADIDPGNFALAARDMIYDLVSRGCIDGDVTAIGKPFCPEIKPVVQAQ